VPEITRAGVRLYYADSGSGPAVFWQTGAGGDGRMWELAGYPGALPGRRHLLIDHRGHGRSGQPSGVEAHRLDEYVADAIAVLDAAGVARAALVGYSDGARALCALAARHPGRVAAVVCIGGVPHPDDAGNLDRAAEAAEVRRLGTRSWLDEMAAGEAEQPPAWFLDNLATTGTEMLALELEGWSTAPTAVADFPLITAPTLIVCGEQENPRGEAELAAAALPDGTAVVLPGLGHLQAFWHSEITAARVRRFLDDRVPA